MTTWWQYIKIRCMERLQYPKDLTFFTIAFFLVQLTGPVFVLALYNTGASIPGWTQWELISLQGMFSITTGIAGTLYWGLVHQASSLVRDGRLELFRIRPVNTLWLLTMHVFNEEEIASLLGGITVLGVAATQLNVASQHLLLTAAYIIPGLLFLLAVAVLAASLHVYFIKVPMLAAILTDILDFSKFPREAFSLVNKTIISLSPLLLITHYPAKAFIGAPIDTNGFLITLTVCLALTTTAFTAWHHALESYDGAHG